MQANAARAHVHYLRFKWLGLIAIALIAVPTVFLQLPLIVAKGVSNPHGAALAFIYLPASILCWQLSLVFLCRSGKDVVRQHLRSALILNAAFVVVLVVAVALFYMYPASFY